MNNLQEKVGEIFLNLISVKLYPGPDIFSSILDSEFKFFYKKTEKIIGLSVSIQKPENSHVPLNSNINLFLKPSMHAIMRRLSDSTGELMELQDSFWARLKFLFNPSKNI